MGTKQKKELGQFFTERDIFYNNEVFLKYMEENNLWNKTILEPFAGANFLIKHLKNIKQDIKFESYDIEPKDVNVKNNDSLEKWNYQPKDLIITNPPYLALNSSKRQNIDSSSFKDSGYDDLYKKCINKCLKNSNRTIAIIPTTLLFSNRKIDQKLINKIEIFQFLPNKENFIDTEHPVALVFFNNNKIKEGIDIYENNFFIGNSIILKKRENEILKKENNLIVNFNIKNGNICVKTIDNSQDRKNILFLEKDFLKDEEVKPTNRHLVKMLINNIEVNELFIEKLNDKIILLRQEKLDIFWTPFKGVNKDGSFRKRISFKTIKKIINSI
ncbi:MAG: hypothetical protein ACRC4M_04650 [Mycoplasma sp.]